MGAGGGASATKSKDNDFWWDVAGWVTLGLCIFGLATLAKNQQPLVPAGATAAASALK